MIDHTVLKADTSLGTEADVATESDYAKNMVVLKVNGNLTIDEGVTLTAYASKNGYGGPKGMTIYCTGTIANHGTVNMTARGAKAVGQNVYLWKNTDGTYEYVPAIGADGGAGISGAPSGSAITFRSNGKNGTNGVNRQTGGGGSGSIYNIGWASSGSGSKGTAYSGGTGGGAVVSSNGTNRK